MKTIEFHFTLPDWPAQRLIKEASFSWSLRHLDEPPIDPDESPWALVRGVVLAFLRHQQTPFDSALRARCEHDQELRDSLAREIARVAYAKYKWLGKEDPRPFPRTETSPVPLFTSLARDLTRQHSVRDQVSSVIRDLKRQGGKQAQVDALTKLLAATEKSIAKDFKTLTDPKHTRGVGGGFCRTFGFNHYPEEIGRYCFLDDRPVAPNRYDYQGFRCQECGESIARLKQLRDFGQGFKVLLYSCHCRALAIVQPPDGGRIASLTAEDWACACGPAEEATP